MKEDLNERSMGRRSYSIDFPEPSLPEESTIPMAEEKMRAQANEQSSSDRHSEQDVPRADAHDPFTLFMGNLAFDVDVEEIRRVFEKWGRITSIRVPKDG
jgi:RNA recognition motif-containing protein